jgi:hypothetical protein
MTDGRAAGDREPGDSSPDGRRLTAEQVLAAVLVAVAVTVTWRLAVPPARTWCCDASRYIEMARDPSRGVATPFAYRIVVPRLVHLLGGVPQDTFARVSLVLMAATGPLVYALARRLGAVHWAALLAMAGLLSSRAWLYYFSDPWLSDPATMLMVAAAFLVLVSGRLWLLAAVGVLFAGVRELFAGVAAPAFGWLLGRLGVVRAALAAGLVVLPGVVAYKWIVSTAPTGKDAQGFGQISLRTTIWLGKFIAERGGMAYFLTAAITLSLGCWWVLAVPSVWDRGVRRLLLWLLPVFGQFLIGGDWGRFALYAFPIVIPAAALTLQRLRPRWRAVVAAVLGLQLLVPLLDVAAGRMTLNRPGPAVPASVVLMAVMTAVLLAAHLSGRRRRPAPDTGVPRAPSAPGRDQQDVLAGDPVRRQVLQQPADRDDDAVVPPDGRAADARPPG